MRITSGTHRAAIDALRVFATYLLFPFHVAMVFNPAPFYHVRNDELSIVAMIFAGFVSLWHMPLFFALAGWSAVTALQNRSVGAFARERVKRLLIPLIFGCVAFAPAIKYVELRSGQDFNHRGLFVARELAESYRSVIPQGLPEMAPFESSFTEFLPTFFTDLDRFSWSHLWFIAYLFTLSFVWLPALAVLARRRGAGAGQARPLPWLFAPMIPLAIVQVLLRPHWPGIQNLYDDWANVAYYSIFLLLGGLLAARPEIERALRGAWVVALGVAAAAVSVLLGAVLGWVHSEPLILALTAVAGWAFLVFLWGAATRWIPKNRRALRYLSESSLPVYVLHQPAIVALALPVVAAGWSPAFAFVVLFAGSTALTLAVYQFAVRPFGLLRWTLGMKRRRAETPLRASVAAAGAIALTLGVAAVAWAEPFSPIGTWWAEGGAAKVRVLECDDGLCARVIWLRSPFDEHGCALRDRYNPDPELRDREMIGIEIVRGLTPDEDDQASFTGGTIYDPTSGRTYRCDLTISSDGQLQIRGFLGLRLIGRTVTWTRVGSEEQMCRMYAP